MAASALHAPGPGGPRRRGSAITFGRAMAGIGVAVVVVLAYNLLSWETVSDRPNEMKTTQVILPPPPPPPPPEPEVVEQPPEPVEAPPIDQPLDTPPPPDQSQSSDPTPGDNALTAREGAGPSNYGLAGGDGSGTRIGGRPGGGGNGFAAYASVARVCVQTALQADRELSRRRYSVNLTVRVDPDGRIASVVAGEGDRDRNARIRDVLTGVQCSQRPPEGLPSMRLAISTRSGT